MMITKPLPTLTEKDKARFCSKISIDDPNRCWAWRGAPNKRGYGCFKVGGRAGSNFLAHRISHEVFKGSIPSGLCALHSCDNPPCVNPRHLFLGTVTDNNADRHCKGRSGGASGDANWAHVHPERMPRGEGHSKAKLTDDSVREIREVYLTGEVAMQSIANHFGVSKKTVLNIIKGKIWKHV